MNEVEGCAVSVDESEQLQWTESSSAEKHIPDLSLNPRFGVVDRPVHLEGGALEIRNTWAQETDLCVFCDGSTCEQANLGKKPQKTFPRSFSGLMLCQRCGLSVCNLCVQLLLERMAKTPGCDPATWVHALEFVQAVQHHSSQCSPKNILCCVTPIGHCCEHQSELEDVILKHKQLTNELVSTVSAVLCLLVCYIVSNYLSIFSQKVKFKEQKLKASHKATSMDGALRYEYVADVFKTAEGCIDVISVAQQSQHSLPGYTPPRRHSVCDPVLASSHLAAGVKPLPSPEFGELYPACGLVRNEIVEKITARCPLYPETHHELRVWLLELVCQGAQSEKIEKGGDLFEDPILISRCLTINDTEMVNKACTNRIDVIMVYLSDPEAPMAPPLLLASLYTGARFRVPPFPQAQTKPFFDSVTEAVPRGCNEVRRVGGSSRNAVVSPDTIRFLKKQRGALPRSRFGVSASILVVADPAFHKRLTLFPSTLFRSRW